METSRPKQFLGFGMAPQGLQGLWGSPPSKQHKNLIQQDGENYQQKMIPNPES